MLEQYRSTLASTSKRYPVLGLALQHHQSTRGGPLDFRTKPFQIELYSDAHQLDDWVFMKAVQTGVSEWAILFALQRAGWSGRIVAYVVRTYEDRDRFVQARVNPLLQNVPAYRERTPRGGMFSKEKAADNLKRKRFGRGLMLFLGANSPGDFVEFSADVMVIDEYDLCERASPENLAKARDRLRQSPHPQRIRIGNPTQPNVGVARLYEATDKRRWWFQCDRCGHRQPCDWFEHVVERDDGGTWVPRDRARWKELAAGRTPMPATDIRPVCLRCRKPFDRVGEGACWVAQAPGKSIRGYRMARCDVLDDLLWALYLEWMEAQGDPARLAAFFTSVLGVAYEHDGTKITVALLEAAAVGASMDRLGGDHYQDKVVTAGIDVGAVLNVSISLVEEDQGDDGDGVIRRPSVFQGAVRTFEEVIDLLERFHVTVAVVDADPETRKSQELRDHFLAAGTTVVWLCRFQPRAAVNQQKYGMKVDFRGFLTTVDRTGAFDQALEDIRGGIRTYPEDVFTVLGWSEQMRAPVRFYDEKKGRVVWDEGGKPDHYRLSDVYDRIAYDMLSMGGSYHGG